MNIGSILGFVWLFLAIVVLATGGDGNDSLIKYYGCLGIANVYFATTISK